MAKEDPDQSRDENREQKVSARFVLLINYASSQNFYLISSLTQLQRKRKMEVAGNRIKLQVVTRDFCWWGSPQDHGHLISPPHKK